MKALTDRQTQMMLVIQGRISRRGAPPTYREIGAAMGINSTNGVGDHLKALIRKGYLRQGIRHGSRCLEVLVPVDIDGKPKDAPPMDGIQKALANHLEQRDSSGDRRAMIDATGPFIKEMAETFDQHADKVAAELVAISKADPAMGLFITAALLQALGKTWRAPKLANLLREAAERPTC